MKIAHFLFIFILLFVAQHPHAAEISHRLDATELVITISFTDTYSNVKAQKTDSELILSFSTTEELHYDRQDFFDSPLKSAWLTAQGEEKRLNFSFTGSVVEPLISTQPKFIIISFPVSSPGTTVATAQDAVPGLGTYIRMFSGLALIIVIILVCYAVMRYFFKHNINTDIPGIGRLLGRVDIEMKKTLLFYELGEIIYILAMTDTNIRLIDKITDPEDVNVIKAGFSRKKDFSSYFRFFGKGKVKEEIEHTSGKIEEKLSSLRKK